MAKLDEKSAINKEFGLSSLAVNNRTSVVILSLLIAIMGIYSYVSMPKESFPEIEIPTIYIGTSYPGNSPVDMENLITRPIEKELKTISGVKKVSSTSVQDFSSIVVEFNPDVSVSKALQDSKDAVDKSKSELPSDLDRDPDVFEIDLSEFPIMNINISGNYSNDELKLFAEYLEDEIEKLPEISKAEIKGAQEREIRVHADVYRMEATQVSFSDIENAIAAENVTMSGGDILTNNFRRSLRVLGEFTDPKELEDVIVKDEDNRIVYVKDVAEVIDTYAERSSYARSSGYPVVIVDVVKRSGENLLNAADKIKLVIDHAKANRFPEDLNISITNDQSRMIRLQVDNLENSIIFGVILVILVLMFFLGFRNALFVGIAIPMSMFMSFMILSFLGVTLNLMVLFALILALGMLVDNGIVVVENIYRLIQEGYSPKEAAKVGVGQVALPIITSTATTLAAFLPLAFWDDLIGEFMKYLPITLIIVLSSSLFVALVINPVLTSLFVKGPEQAKPNKRRGLITSCAMVAIAIFCYFGQYFTIANLLVIFALIIPVNIFLLSPAMDWFQNVFLAKLENIYSRFMQFALKSYRPYLFFGGTFFLLFASIFLLAIKTPKVLFFPDPAPNYINVFIEKPIGTDIEKTNEFTQRVEGDLMKLLEPYNFMVESFIAQVGSGTSDPNEGPGGGQNDTPNKARVTIAFEEYQKRKGVSTFTIMEEVRDLVEQYPGVVIVVDKDAVGPPVGPPINIEVGGEDFEKLVLLTQSLRNEIQSSSIRGIEELKSDLELGKPELLLHIDRDKARRFGLSTSTIATELRTALFGKEVSKFKEGEEEYPIQLRLKDEYRYDVEALMNKKVTFRDKFGNLKQIPISSVASVEYSSTLGNIKRKDMDRVVSLFSNVSEGYNATEITQQLRALINEMDIPDGYTIRFTGEQEEQEKSSEFLTRALFIAVFTIFLIIVAQFNAVTIPFIIMFSVLFSTIGVFLGLVIFQMDFVIIMTGIGIISLAGIVVNNAIVLIDYTNLVRERKREEKGLQEGEFLPIEDLLDSIIEGGKTRLRPVLLTAITTILGLMPMAIGMNINFFTLLSDFDPDFYVGGDNAEFWGPMATTVIFGLTFATFLTLVVVPVMYLITDQLKKLGEPKPKATA